MKTKASQPDSRADHAPLMFMLFSLFVSVSMLGFVYVVGTMV